MKTTKKMKNTCLKMKFSITFLPLSTNEKEILT